MHQPDEQCAPPKAVLMLVSALPMRSRFIRVAVGMDMFRVIAMSMLMEMHAIAPQAPQYVSAEANQHNTDRRLQRSRELFRDRMTYQDCGTGKDEECQRMAEPPRQAVFDDITNVGSAGGYARHSRDVIGFERMLHAEQKADPQDPEHVLPDSI